MSEEKKLSAQEGMKVDSRYLKGDIVDELKNDTEIVSDYSYELLKFHGSYFSYDRDSATQRKKAGLDKKYEFMVRLRLPAGRMTSQQYVKMDELCDKYANGTLRITTRQTFQFHCVMKRNLKKSIADINSVMLSTLGACGDVVRNITAIATPAKNAANKRILEDVERLKNLCEPKTSAYDEIWTDSTTSNRDGDNSSETEPLYNDVYLPRKFKIGLIVPDDNSIDVFTHDLGLVLIFDGDKLLGYNMYLGGGLGMKHNNAATYPRIASPMAFIGADDLLPTVEAVIKMQRDFGDRGNRQHSRLKYLVEEKGLEWTRKTLKEYYAKTIHKSELKDPIDVGNISVADHMGWHEQGDGKLYLGIPISSGRIKDVEGERIRTGLRNIISEYGMNIILTADQNIVLCDIAPEDKLDIEKKLRSYRIKLVDDISTMSRYFMACVALPTCGRALAEAERIKIPLESEIESLMEKHGILREKISIRIAGCPNGCSRAVIGDIGLIGRMPGRYVIHIGGDFEGTRLNTKVFDKVPEKDIVKALDPMLKLYAKEKNIAEGFGDFCTRYGIEKVITQAKESLGEYKWAI